MLHKLRRTMVNPARTKLQETVEVDEATVVYRTNADPVAGGQGRSAAGKLAFALVVVLSNDGKPRRIRMEPIADYTAETLHGFVRCNVAAKSTVRTDGNPSYTSAPML